MLNSYIYIDQNGINSLLAQINNELLSELREQSTNRIQGAIEGHAGIPQILNSIVQADVNGAAEFETTKSIEKTLVFPHEVRIPELLRILEANQCLIKDLAQIQKKGAKTANSFLHADLKFDTDFDSMNWGEAVETAKRIGFITLYIPNDKYEAKNSSSYIENDSYYKKEKKPIYISMDMGIQNMLQFGGYTSHLATFFRGTKGKAMPLGVFGRIFRITDDFYQIKPYAVWRL